MTDTKTQATEFLWRRLSEPPELFGQPLDFHPWWWLAVALPLVLVALVAIYLLYVREHRTIGWPWAGFLAAVRTLTVMVLFLIWLLPATRQVEWSEQRSRVLILSDGSGSMHLSDDPPADVPGTLRRTRQELVLELLTRQAAAAPSSADDATKLATQAEAPIEQRPLVPRLLERNPLFLFRFGERLDPNPWIIEGPSPPDASAWSQRLQPVTRATLADPVAGVVLDELAQAAAQLQSVDQLNPELRQRREKEVIENLERALAERERVLARLLNRTNLGASLGELLDREGNNLIQGIIVISDGRSNTGSQQELEEALKKARDIPIFTVGVGRHREAINLRLLDVLGPGRVQPEDEFPIRVVVEGENVPRQQEATVILNVEKPNGTKEDLPAHKVTLTPTTGRLATGAAEFRITNPEKLKGDWKLRGRVEPVRGEQTRGDNASEEPTIVKVEDRKLSVLLFASAPTREYQFLRSLLTREQDKFDLAIHLQSFQSGTVQDIDPKRLLEKFPSDLRERDAEPSNLGHYDVIIAFDPDWKQVPRSSLENLRRWVTDFGGGLVAIAGPVHTFALARDRDLEPIRDLYPVELDNEATYFVVAERPSRDPWALNWGPGAATQPFLDLTDSGDPTRVLEGWEDFFDVTRNPDTGVADAAARRGFFTFFPLKDAKPGATIIARFSDPARDFLTRRGERQPFLVTHKAGKGPVFYIGSGEMYRLREYSDKFHERFWTKLVRHLGKREAARGLLVVGSRYVEGDIVVVEAQVFDAELRPLKPDPNAKVLLKVVPPETVTDAPREWHDGLPMEADTGRPGWFTVRFQAKKSGKYGIEVRIPGSNEKLLGKFRVESSDPERDDARPDLAALHRIATEAKKASMLDERKRPDLLKALAKAREAILSEEQAGSPGARALAETAAGDRLFFDLETAPWIAECIDSTVVPFRTEGKVSDIWDKGWTVFSDLEHPDDADGPPWALVLVVLLLSFEWLTRKLLKLA
jgi:hypothetical protein